MRLRIAQIEETMNSPHEFSVPPDFTVGTGRASLYYTEVERRLSFDMYHEDRSGIPDIFVDRMPHWYATADFSTLGPVAEQDRLRILRNIRSGLEKQGYYRCVFQDKNYVPIEA